MNPDWLEAVSTKWFDTKLAVEVLPLLIEATGITIYVTVTAWMLAMVIGFPLLLLRRTRIRLIARPINFLVEFIRSTPILVQIYFFFYVLPDFGIVLSAVATGIFAMTLHYGCYMSEVYRSGLESIHHGQWDAVTALGFSRIDTYRYVILPQMVPPLVPASGNFLVFMIKDSPLLASIGATELMFVASGIGMDTFQYLEPITMVGLIFLVLSLLGAAGTRLVEARVGRVWLGKDRGRA